MAAIFGILWRATLLFPLAVAFYCLVIVWLVFLPGLLLIYALTETSWAWAGLAAWMFSLYVFRKPVQTISGIVILTVISDLPPRG